MRRLTTRLMAFGTFVALIESGITAFSQDSAAEWGHGLSDAEAAAGWVSLFDGRTTFGWAEAGLVNGRLVGGTTTTELGDCELRGDVERGGTLVVGGKSVAIEPGRLVIPSTGRRGPVRLDDRVVVRSLTVRPLGLRTLFDGRRLNGCTRVNPPKARPGTGPTWAIDEGMLHAKGGPGAMELPGRYADFTLQVAVRTRGRHSNGGVFFRNPPGTCMMGYEVQIYNRCEGDDPARPAVYATGAIDERENARRLVSRDGEPFVVTVVAHGPQIVTWVNGVQVTDWTDTRPKNETPRRGSRTEAGTIQLQAHDPDTDLAFGRVSIAPID
jgi:hypothetical protein